MGCGMRIRNGDDERGLGIGKGDSFYLTAWELLCDCHDVSSTYLTWFNILYAFQTQLYTRRRKHKRAVVAVVVVAMVCVMRIRYHILFT